MIGILAVQGGFRAHRNTLDQLRVPNREVRLAKQLDDLHALILPGGESTTMLKLIEAFNLLQPLQDFAASGRPVLGTCAGAILMSGRVRYKNQPSLGWIPVEIDRNVYGSQRESFSDLIDIPAWKLARVPVMFIRAPRFTDPQEGVRVISKWGNDITGVSYKNFTAVTYHPELGGESRFHQTWLDRAMLSKGALS